MRACRMNKEREGGPGRESKSLARPGTLQLWPMWEGLRSAQER